MRRHLGLLAGLLTAFSIAGIVPAAAQRTEGAADKPGGVELAPSMPDQPATRGMSKPMAVPAPAAPAAPGALAPVKTAPPPPPAVVVVPPAPPAVAVQPPAVLPPPPAAATPPASPPPAAPK